MSSILNEMIFEYPHVSVGDKEIRKKGDNINVCDVCSLSMMNNS